MQYSNIIEHKDCVNLENSSRPSVEVKTLAKSETWRENTIENELICVLKGTLRYSFGGYIDLKIGVGQILFVPSAQMLDLESITGSQFIVIRIFRKIRLCDTLSLENLIEEAKQSQTIFNISPYLLETNNILQLYMDQLIVYVKNSIQCHVFWSDRLKELFYILRIFYTKDQLVHFFGPLLNVNTEFLYQVVRNSRKYNSIGEIASAMNYTISGFQKKFKKTFGTSGHQWLKEQRKKEILHEILHSNNSLKDISDNFGFSTPSHFNNFCKQNLGKTPGQIRQNDKNGGYMEKL